ncbi:hypothetical protein Pint_07344 [Pistacia integerrima]|uniref:Uncharacterized protein n=1 Tax=Pistacia integerrima TaxID=434235 RepID=A0ACC0XYJ9_9ROSI|nr:hypothetical protein Pint_07344 [Pistacia integerrima]
MNLDLVLHICEPDAITELSTQKVHFENWECSNGLSLMLVKANIFKSIKGSIPECTKATDYLTAMDGQFIKSGKQMASTLMEKLSSMKHHGLKGVRDHIMRMRDLVTQLKELEIDISESFL